MIEAIQPYRIDEEKLSTVFFQTFLTLHNASDNAPRTAPLKGTKRDAKTKPENSDQVQFTTRFLVAVHPYC
jgi:hypothetical protein